MLLAAPRYFALALVGVAAIALGRINLEARDRSDVVAPGVEHVQDVIACASWLTVPAVFVLLLAAWRYVHAPRRTKRRHVVRSTAMQAGAVTLGVLAMVAARPSSASVLASAAGPGGRVAYVYPWDWGCGYRIGVSDGPYMVRGIAAIGPFECEAKAPRVEWRGHDVALVAADGKLLGTWEPER